MAVFGVYRGICVDSNDPEHMGRVRVQVPQVMGNSASGWAFPSWVQGDMVVWPEDRLPQPGQGVWVLFESRDRLTWISVFGPPEDSGQEYDLEDYAYQTSIAMILPAMPENIPVAVNGSLIALQVEIPGPDAVVHFEKSEFEAGPWTRVVTIPVLYTDGSWSTDYARPDTEIGWWYRAVFDGLAPFKPSETAPEQAADPSIVSVITWNDPEFRWKYPDAVVGTLTVAGTGAGCIDSTVTMYLRRVTPTNDQPWSPIGAGTTDWAGNYTIPWTRPEAMTYPVEIRVVFPGSTNYDYSEIPIPPKVLPQVSVPTTLTWTPPEITEIDQPVTFTGNLTSEYGCPYPDARVVLDTRSPSATTPPAGVWTAAASVVAEAATGNWTLPFTVTKASCDYRVRFEGTGVFQAAPSPPEHTAVVALQTSVTAPNVPSTINVTQSVTASGYVTDELGRRVRTGFCVLQTRETGQGWVNQNTRAVDAYGNYSIPCTVNRVGSWEFRVQYLENLAYGYFGSTGPSTTRSVGIPATSMSKGTLYPHHAADFAWNAVAGAAYYEVFIWYGGLPDWSMGHGTWTSTSFQWGGLWEDGEFHFTVRAKAQDAAGNWVYAPLAAEIICNMGHSELRNIGSLARDNYPLGSANWRPQGGWNQWNSGQAAQGYYGSSGWYRGVIQYNGGDFQNWVRNNYGQGVLDNLNWLECRIGLKRNPDSSNGTGAQPVRFYVTDSWPGGGDLFFQGGEDGYNSSARNAIQYIGQGQHTWFWIPPHWGAHVLLNQWVGGRQIISIGIARDVDGSYAMFEPYQGDWAGCGWESYQNWMWVSCNWNYVTRYYQGPWWY